MIENQRYQVRETTPKHWESRLIDREMQRCRSTTWRFIAAGYIAALILCLVLLS